MAMWWRWQQRGALPCELRADVGGSLHQPRHSIAPHTHTVEGQEPTIRYHGDKGALAATWGIAV